MIFAWETEHMRIISLFTWPIWGFRAEFQFRGDYGSWAPGITPSDREVVHQYQPTAGTLQNRKSKVVHVQATKAYGRVEIKLHSFLTSVLNGSEWSASCTGRFTLGTHWTGGWMSPRTVVDALETREFASFCEESKHDPKVFQPVA
jgi:hypothetical protein